MALLALRVLLSPPTVRRLRWISPRHCPARCPRSWAASILTEKDVWLLVPTMKNLFFFFAVREKIGPIATPDYIQYAPSLPKTRSGEFQEWCWGALDGSCQWKLISPALLVQCCSDWGGASSG